MLGSSIYLFIYLLVCSVCILTLFFYGSLVEALVACHLQPLHLPFGMI